MRNIQAIFHNENRWLALLKDKFIDDGNRALRTILSLLAGFAYGLGGITIWFAINKSAGSGVSNVGHIWKDDVT